MTEGRAYDEMAAGCGLVEAMLGNVRRFVWDRGAEVQIWVVERADWGESKPCWRKLVG